MATYVAKPYKKENSKFAEIKGTKNVSMVGDDRNQTNVHGVMGKEYKASSNMLENYEIVISLPICSVMTLEYLSLNI